MPRNDIRFRGMKTPEVACNTEDASLAFTGCVCRTNASGALVAAQANSVANAKAAFFVFQGHRYRAGLLGTGPIQVRLKEGLNSGTAPAINQVVYLSAATAGKATNVEPSGGTNQSVKLGIIQDLGVDGYDNTNGSLCTIISVQQGTPGADGTPGGASDLGYTADEAIDWDVEPDNVASGLDELAQRMKDLEARVTALE